MILLAPTSAVGFSLATFSVVLLSCSALSPDKRTGENDGSLTHADLSRAADFVRGSEDSYAKTLLRYVLKRKPPIGRAFLAELGQNRKGGWPFRRKLPDLSSTGETVFQLGTVLTLVRNNGDAIPKETIDLLFSRQGDDGAWDEPAEAADKLKLPFWLDPGKLSTKYWQTANALCVLLSLGYRDDSRVARGVAFLEKNSTADFQVPTTRHGYFLLAAVLWQTKGGDADLTRTFLKKSIQKVDETWEGWEFAWGLEMLYLAGLPAEHEVVRTYWKELCSRQAADGRFPSKYGGEARNTAKVINVHNAWFPKRAFLGDHDD